MRGRRVPDRGERNALPLPVNQSLVYRVACALIHLTSSATGYQIHVPLCRPKRASCVAFSMFKNGMYVTGSMLLSRVPLAATGFCGSSNFVP